MSTEPSAHTPLYDPKTDGRTYAPPLDSALARARKVLEEKAGANIHDHDEMLRAAVSLEMRLRQLVAAIDEDASQKQQSGDTRG
ncbi:hypothetical protein [Streptomyces sp. NPDC048438]|uniref:hypothetical protein n=1 Tax=Streptomyces sp. NPDC048438 TaxID=3365551 RepID=UPI003723A5CF